MSTTLAAEPELILFDCDGVLVDSETIACRIDAALFTAAGFPLCFEDIRREFVGISATAMCRAIEQRFGRKLPTDMPQRLLTAAVEAFETQLTPIPGVDAALATLSGPRCVASSSDPARIRRSLEITGLLHHFDPHLFSTVMVERGKPAPDIFLHAARAMGADPARCIVIEDSVPGVAAAHAAGMTAFGFCGGDHCPPGHSRQLRDAGADLVFDQMHRLPRLLAVR